MVDHPDNSPIHPDADRYSADVAARRYVKHPTGLPQPTEHWLVLGPRGAGKTIMLKTLYTQWNGSARLHPVYIELQPRIAKISGELSMWGHEPLSPRDRAMLDCMSLAVSLALISKVVETAGSQCAMEAIDLFGWTTDGHDAEAWIKAATRRLRQAGV